MISDFGNEMKKVFVDRSVELAKLHTALKEAEKGNIQIILIEGETGIGKSALVARFISDIKKKKFQIKQSECKAGISSPYVPIIDLLGEAPIKKKKSVGSSSLLGLVSSSGGQSPEDMGSDRDKVLREFVDQFKKESMKKPSVVFVDNVQWMDEASAKVVSVSTNRMAGARILFIMAYRPEEISRSGPIYRMISEIKTKESTTTIQLRRLDFEDSEEMIKKILKREDIPKSFSNTVYKETEGNPLFIKELISSLIQEGILDPTSYKKIKPGDIRIPAGIKEVLMRRISKLNPESRKILNYAAIVGPRFSFDMLQKISGLDEEALLDIIDGLLDARVIEEDRSTDEEVYIFTYLQIRDIIEESMSKSRRRVLHKKIAEYMEKSDAEPYEIAEHYYRGNVCDKAYEYALKSAEKSSSTFGFESAIHFYNMALECGEKSGASDEEDMLGIFSRLGALYMAIGDWDSAMREYKKALKIADRLGKRNIVAEINLQMGNIEKNRGAWDDANICFEAAEKVARDIGDKHLMGDAERGMGTVHWRKSEYKDAAMHYTSAIKYAKETNDSGMAGKVFVEMGNVYSDMGNMDKAIEYYKKSIPRLKNIRRYDEIARVLNNLGDGYMQKGDWDRAIEYFKRCEDTAASIGDLNQIAWAQFNSAEAYLRKGDVKKARELCEESMNSLSKMDDRIGMASVYRVCGMVAMEEGRDVDAIKMLQKSVKMFKELEARHLLAMSEMELANAFARKGDVKHARKWYEEALSIFRSIGASLYIERVEKGLKELEKA